MPSDILISSDPWENRVAILEDGKLNEFYIERDERVIGSIYKAKVQNVLPGMGASFVDIGLGRNAFLYVDDINKSPLNIGDVEVTGGRTGWTINEKVAKGDDVLVQIVKEPRGLKGARVSTNISLPGRYLILMPTGKYSGVSRKIESADERNRLKTIMKAIRPEGMATVVRTAAGGVSNAELIADLGVLIRMWHGILENYKSAPTASLLHKDMNLVYKAARDFITPEVQNVWIDDAEEAERVRDFMRLLGPQYVERIKPYPKGRALFTDFHVDEEVARLMKPTVKLPSGGSIVIETTEALTVIDVNSGKFTGGKNLDDTIVKTNVEAAAEIARQVRLRDIGGIIVCDFIDMQSENDRNRVIKTLEDGLRKDRTRSTIQSFSPLGLLEFTRKRVGKDLAGQLRSACPTCSGLGSVMSPESVTISTFRQVLAMQNGSHDHVTIESPPTVAAQIEFWYEDELKELTARVGSALDVRVNPALNPEKTLVRFGNGLPELSPIRVGDEVEVDLLPIRLPIATNAAAVLNGRLIEVENAATAAGQTIRVRIIDVDGADILAEPRTPVAEAAAEERSKKRRRRGGRGRKPLTLAEQEEELRELAEEAAKGAVTRPALGISTAEEAVAEDLATKEVMPAEAVAELEAAGNPSPPPRRDSGRDRGRGGRDERPRPSAPAAPAFVPPPSNGNGARPPVITALPGESLSGTLAARLPGETLSGDRVRDAVPVAVSVAVPVVPPVVIPPVVAALAASPYDDDEPTNGEPGESGAPRRRRRRRRGRGGAGAAAQEAIVAAAAPPVVLDDVEDAGLGNEVDDVEGVAESATPLAPGEADGTRRRRRRRRRRGGRPSEPLVDGAPPLADRQIIRVDSDGAAHPTDEVAPVPPSRAIAPWNRPRKGEVAIEPPPPVISAPPEPVEALKVASPARRRISTRPRGPVAPAAIEAVEMTALPASKKPAKAATPAAAEPAKAPTRRKAAAAEPVAAPEPVAAAKPRARRTAAAAAPATSARKTTAAAKKAPAVKKAPAAKKTAASAAVKKAPAKAPAARKAPAAAKKSPRKKA